MAGKSLGQLKIGILALQGDVALHSACLQQLGVATILVKRPNQLQDLDGLIIPGGESTALLKLAEPIDMLPALKKFVAAGGSIFGTCAGAILLANQVTNPPQTSLHLIDINIERNAYGRQLDSTNAVGQALLPFGHDPLPLTFIRAPRISFVGKNVKTLAEYNHQPVLVQQKNILASTFHPELTSDLRVYKYWVGKISS